MMMMNTLKPEAVRRTYMDSVNSASSVILSLNPEELVQAH
jgi:hypothetical protein